jgi:hypothetical protein
MKRRVCAAVVCFCALLLYGPQAWAGPSYTGTLASDYDSGNSFGADGLLIGNNGWVHAEDPLILRWEVSFDGSLWHYQYTFNELDVQGGLSHLVLEVSDSLQASDIIDPSHPLAEGDPKWYGPGNPSNPSIPDDVWSIKLDTGGGSATIVSFYSPRSPVWGDIYAKDGSVGGAAWNAGFTSPDIDPLFAPANGSIDSHVLVPDSTTTVVPVPGAVLLGVMGSVLVGWLWRKRSLA